MKFLKTPYPASMSNGVKQFKFLITPIGTGLAGYSHEQIAPMFRDAPENCILPKEWEFILAEIKTRIKV